jgi:glutamine synthetase
MVDSYFGSMVFDRRTMKRYLSNSENNRFLDALNAGKSIDFSTADAIANALLRWATERGATHYTHWFQVSTAHTVEVCAACRI